MYLSKMYSQLLTGFTDYLFNYSILPQQEPNTIRCFIIFFIVCFIIFVIFQKNGISKFTFTVSSAFKH